MKTQLIGHLDADCFYVSAERIRQPSLHNIPVGVIGNMGACCIAKSYELKNFGVKTGQPIWEVVKLCPQSVFIKRDFRWYEVVSRQMLEIVQSASPTVEYYSIDEFFFDADKVDPWALQQQILNDVGVPVTIGISRSRTLAKLASDAGKPFGCRVLTDPDDIAQYVESIPVDEITGIAGRSAAKLAMHNIRTCGDFRRANPKLINKLLTKVGEGLYWEMHGQPIQKISTTRPMHKHIGRGGSIGQATDDRDIQSAWLTRNLERLIEAMFWNRYLASRVTLSIGFKIGYWSASTTLPEASGSFEVLHPAFKFLFDKSPAGTVTHIDLSADQLQLAGQHQRSLFTSSARIDSIKRAVNDKMGRFSVRSGETLPLHELYVDSAHSYEICDVQGKMCF